jgi:NAD-dependent dihydropyrimidine dehydrogenase PreA subunit
MLKPIRDEKRCIGCGECVVVCPQSQPETTTPVLVTQGPGEKPLVMSIENCIECMSCVDVCRASAITFEGARWAPRLIVDERLQAIVRKIL